VENMGLGMHRRKEEEKKRDTSGAWYAIHTLPNYIIRNDVTLYIMLKSR
jgi:hypothetical protein